MIQTPPELKPSRCAATSQTVDLLAVDTVIASRRQVKTDRGPQPAGLSTGAAAGIEGGERVGER